MKKSLNISIIVNFLIRVTEIYVPIICNYTDITVSIYYIRLFQVYLKLITIKNQLKLVYFYHYE